jgi:hypothetical protein
VLPFAEVQRHMARQIDADQAFCAEAVKADLPIRGRPVKNAIDR